MAVRREGKFGLNVPTFHGNADDDFRLWELRLKAARWGKELFHVLAREQVEKKIFEKALSIIVSALVGDPLRATHNCKTTSVACTKSHERYAGKLAINKCSTLNNSINTRYDRRSGIVDHVV